MSTRAQIVLIDLVGKVHPERIYKHSDGYPEGVLPVLEPFAMAFASSRGWDPEYFLAQCLRRFAVEDYKEDPSSLDSFTGWGVDSDWHGDIEYIYAVRWDGSVITYQIDEETLGERERTATVIPSFFRVVAP